MIPDAVGTRFWRRMTLATLALALALRAWLAWGGGEGYWPDEARYVAAAEAVHRFGEGQLRAGWLALLGGAEHPFFKVAALPAAWADARFGEAPARTAIYFGLFSVAALACIGRCARAAGAGPREAWLAVFFATLANSLLYYSRHLLPYDLSLFFCLAALATALGPPARWRSFAAGLLSGIGFLSYDGYWIFGAVTLVWHVFRGQSWRRSAGRAAISGAGLILPLAAAVAGAKWAGGDLVASFRQFARSINQGDFGRGHALVWSYLWEAEGGMLLVWLAAAVYAAIWAGRRREWGRPMAWLAAGAAIYGGLCVCSDLFRLFVIYGRIARLLAPFFCLIAAWSADDLWTRRRWTGTLAAGWLALVGLVAAFRLAIPLRQMFPAQFKPLAARLADRAPAGMFRLRNVDRLAGGVTSAEGEPGRVLFEMPHPMQFRAYLYEGYNEDQRRNLESRDIAMKLVRLAVPMPPPFADGYPGPLRLRVRFPEGHLGYSEPLVAIGVTGQASLLAVRYLDADHVAFTYDCWNFGGLASAPLRVDYGAEHDLLIFFGGMLPPRMPAGLSLPDGLLQRMRNDLLVVLDGRIVLAGRVHVFSAPPKQITVGVNFVEGSSGAESFNGRVVSAEAAGLAEIASYLPQFRADALRLETDWGGYPGPLNLELTLPRDRAPGMEPLVTAGSNAAAEGLRLIYEPGGAVRLEYKAGGSSPLAGAQKGQTGGPSAPLLIPSDGRLDLLISMGALMPPLGHRLYVVHPELEMLRDRIFVRAGERSVIDRSVAEPPLGPQAIQILSNQTGVPGVAAYYAGSIGAVRAAEPERVLDGLAQVSKAASSADPEWKGYPGPLRMRIRFPEGSANSSEPLLVSGVTGAGDFIYVRYEGAERIRLGFDHWSRGGAVSAVVELEQRRDEHELVVSDGVLLPPDASGLFAQHPAWRRLRDWVVVALDGKPLIVAPARAYASRPDQILAGLNLIGGSTAAGRFGGDITGIERASPDSVLDWINAASALAPAPR